MAKTNIDRLNDTLDQIKPLADEYPRAFGVISPQKLRELLFKVLANDPYLKHETDAVSENLSMGSRFPIHTAAGTRLRSLKRLVILIYQVMGFHSHAQTRIFQAQVHAMSEQRCLQELSQQLARGVQLQQDSLRDWLLKTVTEDGGRLVHYYNQGEDNRLQQIDFTENGWCLGVSTQWLRFKGTGGDFWRWMESEEGAGALRFVMAAQGVRVSKGLDMADRAEFALKRFGFTKDITIESEGATATPLQMARNICDTRGGNYCRIGQSYVTGGGHAMAAFREDSGVYFMDPNAGELYLPSAAALESWLPKFVRRIRYEFRRHYAERFSYKPVVQVEAPLSVEQTLRNAMAQRRTAMGY